MVVGEVEHTTFYFSNPCVLSRHSWVIKMERFQFYKYIIFKQLLYFNIMMSVCWLDVQIVT